VDCSGDISPKRLAALPWAARCVSCQEAVEAEDRDGRRAGLDAIGEAA
jgi:RNA polymerase-binding transcription factor DksA